MKNSHFTPIILAKSHQNINFNNSLENHSTQTELNTKSNVPKKAALETKYISFMSKVSKRVKWRDKAMYR